MLAEACFGDGEIDEGRRQLHRLLPAAFDVVDFCDRPVAIDGGIAVEIEAFGDRAAAVGIVAKQRIGTRLDGELGLVLAHVVADAVFGLA